MPFFINLLNVMISCQHKSRIIEIEKNILRTKLLIKKTEKLSSLIGLIRFFVFLFGIIVFFLLFSFLSEIEAAISLIVFSTLFIIVSIKQTKILNAIKKQKKWVVLKQNNLSRAKLNWDEIPPSKLKNEINKSPLENDLDLTGERSLHRLIDLSKSHEGSSLLRDYLVNKDISKEEILLRQSIVKELITLSHFRHRFVLESNLSSNKEIETDSFLNWLSLTNKSAQIKKKLIVLFPLCIINLIFILFALVDLINGLWGVTLIMYTGYYLLNQRSIKTLAAESDILNDEFKKIIRVLEFVENYSFGKNKKIAALCSPLTNKEISPSTRLKKINRVITALSFRNNPVVWNLAVIIFPLDYYLAYLIESYKEQVKKLLPEWLEVRKSWKFLFRWQITHI